MSFAFKNAASRSNANKECVAPMNTKTSRFVDEFQTDLHCRSPPSSLFPSCENKSEEVWKCPTVIPTRFPSQRCICKRCTMLLFRYTHLSATSTYFKNVPRCFLPSWLKIFAEIVESRIGYRNTTCWNKKQIDSSNNVRTINNDYLETYLKIIER